MGSWDRGRARADENFDTNRELVEVDLASCTLHLVTVKLQVEAVLSSGIAPELLVFQLRRMSGH